LFLASLPSGLPRNPNVLLIRTHPNPSPSVANNYSAAISPMRHSVMLLSDALSIQYSNVAFYTYSTIIAA
jgi:hypothetical protein